MSSITPQILLASLGEILLDKEKALRLVVAGLLAGGHVLVEDLPGVGKTTLALGLSRLLGLDFTRVQMTADLLPGDLIGVTLFDPEQKGFAFHPGPLFHAVVLIDEINRASPRTQSALLEAMAEGQVSVDGRSHPLPHPFFVIATQNPKEHAGVFPLPESQLDRFMIRMAIGYPSAQAELQLLAGKHRDPAVLLPLADASLVAAWQGTVRQVFLSDEITAMILALARQSRSDVRIALGLSPRGVLALKAMVQAWAYLQGRDFVVPEDLQAVSVAVVGHRLLPVAAQQDGSDLAALLMQEVWGFGP